MFGSPNGAVELPPGGALGLVRAVEGERHRYGLGAPPPGEIAGELGALHGVPEPGSIPIWITADGFLVPAGGPPPPGRPRRVHWVLAPLRWGGGLGAVAWRLARAHRSPGPVAAAEGAPAGYLRADPGDGRLPLYAARHAITGDQLLSTHALDTSDCGYGEGVLLGYLDAMAPATGVLGVTARPRLPWASRLGRLVRLG